MPNQFMAFRSTGKGIMSTYIAESMVDMIRRNKNSNHKDDQIKFYAQFKEKYFNKDYAEKNYS
jgi:hypothetical protein